MREVGALLSTELVGSPHRAGEHIMNREEEHIMNREEELDY